MELTEAIRTLIEQTPTPSRGLPEEVFRFIRRSTPLVNVDLLVKDENGRTLLSWRDDPWAGTGWHVPGGIVRFQETLEARVEKVAETEIGVPVQYGPQPIAVNQLILPALDVRGHFVSFLYRCRLGGAFVPANRGMTAREPGYLLWHDRCPPNLIPMHEIYRKKIDEYAETQ